MGKIKKGPWVVVKSKEDEGPSGLRVNEINGAHGQFRILQKNVTERRVYAAFGKPV